MHLRKIRKGALVLLTTDTVCGVGGVFTDKSKQEINSLKGAPENKILAILVPNISSARKLEEWTPKAERIATSFWPGPVTIALRTYGVRMPNCSALRRLLTKTGPLYVSSANTHGKKTMDFQTAKKAFKKTLKIHADFCPKASNVPSWIIRATDNKILRRGETSLVKKTKYF